MTKNPFHKWLIRQRRYCEHKNCLLLASVVKNVNGKDFVYCDWHAQGQIEAGLRERGRLEAR